MLHAGPPLCPVLQALLQQAMFPDPARVALAFEAYRRLPGRHIFSWEEQGRAVSAAGLQVDGRVAELLHLGTCPEATRQGHARRLLQAVTAHLDLKELSAETDDEAAGFYRRSGFAVSPAPSKGGRSRFRCVWTAPA
ncbi:GNAT family N-acetyltransferase [Deinococcus navajonensis]|uniref:GNAT family N-acetyltransferase n=1 Tax=Deinococcus navajonensis TaxID=309884 RepID=A0ABV8XSU1_9DEIO